MACSCGGYYVPTESGDVQYWHSDNCKAWTPSRSGEMADTGDLKSPDLKSHPGSSPGSGTIFYDESAKFKDKDFRIIQLSSQRKAMIEYLQWKIVEKDWHGVQDAASDLRDIDSELKGLNFKS